MKKRKIVLHAKPECPQCKGSGYVVDWVPYGMGNTRMETECECLYTDLSDYEVAMIEEGRFDVEVVPEVKP